MALSSPTRMSRTGQHVLLEGVGGAPRLVLAQLPTPLQRATRLEHVLGCPPLYVKRDDLTGFALGGNKVRKLEYLLGRALTEGADVLITGGGPTSNHCMTAAAAARVSGLGCILVLYGEPPEHPPTALHVARQFGPQLRFTGDPDRRSVDRWLPAVARQQRAGGRRPSVVPRGGATLVGSLAYVQALEELAAQLASRQLEAECLLVATGSCGTQAGLLAASIAGGHPWRVVGASVSRPVDECAERVLTLATACAERLGSRPPRRDEVVLRDARGPGFGKPSQPGEDLARQAAEAEGLLLDPFYTAKAMAELSGLAAEGLTGPVVFWHTGGTPAVLSPSRGTPEESADPAHGARTSTSSP